MKRVVLILFVFAMAVNLSLAQGQLYYKYENDSLKIRWTIADPATWAEAVKFGFQITRKDLTTGIEAVFQVKNQLVSGIADPELEYEAVNFVALLLDESKADVAFIQGLFEDNFFDEDITKEARRDLVDLNLNTESQLIYDAGFGFIDAEIDPSHNYTYQIISGQNENPIYIQILDFNSSAYKASDCPPLSAKWNNRQAKLRWKTKDHNQIYYGYQVLSSLDGAPFTELDDLIINPRDTSAETYFHFLERSIFLEDNDKQYRFRIHGMDYFGERSECYSEIVGQGDLGIGLSPLIESADRNLDNEVLLKWNIDERFANSVTEWRIYTGQSWEGPYGIDTTGINPEVRETKRLVPYDDTYYRVVAVDRNENELSSFPQLVVAADTIPPAVPTGISAEIDSNGIVKMVWTPNTERDFYGYKVFYGFDTIREMTLAHALPFPEPQFLDTIGLISKNRKLYYKILSVDRRNNRSAFSDIVKLIKPDILAPVEPIFYDYRSAPEGTTMSWHKSVSEDVVNQKLFRRNIENESTWTLVQEWSLPDIDSTFQDEGLQAFSSYAYILVVEDGAGNLSEPSRPVVIKTLPNHSKIDIDAWEIERIEDVIEFSHSYFDPAIEEIRIYKKVGDELPFEMARLQPAQLSFQDKKISKTQTQAYFIQILMADGFKTKFSNQKIAN